jgi:chromosomal replication initiator protein
MTPEPAAPGHLTPDTLAPDTPSPDTLTTGPLRSGLLTPEQAWDRVARRLRAELGEDVFSSWFGRLAFSEMSDGVAHLTVPTRFLKSWIQSHYVDRVRALFMAECPDVRQISVGVRTGLQRALPRAVSLAETAPVERQRRRRGI